MIHLIGNAHIDPVWLWKRSEGLAEIRATFRSALERMKEFSEYHFTSACAYYYAWIEAVDPPMLREIQQRVQEGRWHIAGGMWVQPDNHIPSGESLVRHFLYSQRTFRRLFGQTARVGYLVDSFGQNGMTPQLLKKAGMDYFVFQRPDLTEKDWETELFLWESPDGSRVLCYRMPKPYGEQCGGVLADELID
ncbi:MAG: alpha-mannosidase, partial [Clostridia bacterium]|nr:alpha-mannosidase [Clostridia bacterium]